MRTIIASLALICVLTGSVPLQADGHSEEIPQHPWLGMGIRSHFDATERRFLHVERVTPNGPADDAGVIPGDIVLSIGNNTLQHSDDLDLLLFIASRKPGEQLKLSLIRDGRMLQLSLIVGLLPSAVAAWERTVASARQRRLMTIQRKR